MRESPAWLKRPVVEFARDSKRICSAMVRLREGKASYTSQPNPQHQVFFFWGSDDLPVAIQFLEPVEGVAVIEILHRLVTGPDGGPDGVGMGTRGPCLSLGAIVRTVQAIGEAVDKLPEPVGA